MWKMSGECPLSTIFKNCLKYEMFSDDRKKRNIVATYIKKSRRFKNYCQVFFLPICSKVFDRIIYDNMLKYALDIKLISSKQSGFRPGDSCVNQLLSITHSCVNQFLSITQEEYFGHI